MAVLTSLADVVAAVPSSAGRVVVGIVGEPGAGKSTVGAELVRALGPTAGLLPMDGYHLPQAELRRLGRRDRMGAPDTFDVGGLVTTLAEVRNSGTTVFAPAFDREIEEAVPGAIIVPPELRTIVVEGNYLLLGSGGWEAVAPLLDTTFYLSLDEGERLERLIARHVRYGKSPEHARAWALGPDETNARLIRTTEPLADHVIRLP